MMIKGAVASNRRIKPFITELTDFNPSGGNAACSIFALNNQYVLQDVGAGDIMTSSNAISGYSDVITTGNAGLAGRWAYQNGRYFSYNSTSDELFTGTTVAGTTTAVGGTADLRAPIVWHAPTNAWWAVGDDGNTQAGGGCLIRYSTNGTTWTTITTNEPSTLRLLGIASDGTRLVISSEGASAITSVIKYSTSTNPASMTWVTATEPFSVTADISQMKYHPAKSTFTCSSSQSVFAYSTDAGSNWTAKDLGWGGNGEILVEWVPWHNRWVACINANRQFAVSDTSDIGGTWTLGTYSSSTSNPRSYATFFADPARNYIIAGAGLIGGGNNVTRSI